jgi:hypothetical protein
MVLARRGSPGPGTVAASAAGSTDESSAAGQSSDSVARSGLGVSRQQLQDALHSPSLPRFEYRESEPVEGQPRLTGSLGDDRAVVELIGPEDNLTEARLVLPLTSRVVAGASDTPARTDLYVPDAAYMVALAREVAPQWREAGPWIESSLPQAIHGVAATTRQNGVELSLDRIDKFGLLMMTVRGK